MALEELARKFSNIAVIFLPPCSPVLNPIERFWRLIKAFVRKCNGSLTMTQLRTVINAHFFLRFWVSHLPRMFSLSALYRKWLYHKETTASSPHGRIVPPYEEKLERMERGHLLKPVPTADVDDLLGHPTTPSDLDIDEVRGHLHSINFCRVVRDR